MRRADPLHHHRACGSAEISQPCGGQKLCASYQLVLTPPDGWVLDKQASSENKVRIMVPKGQSFTTAEPLIYVQVFYQPDKALAAKRPSKGDGNNYDPKSKVRFRLAVHPSRLASLAPQDDGPRVARLTW
jgi:hypothetical protein